MREIIECRTLQDDKYSRYRIYNTGELVEQVSDTEIKTVQPRINDSKLLVKLSDQYGNIEWFDYHMLYYKTFRDISNSIEKEFDIETVDGNPFNISLDNLRLKRKDTDKKADLRAVLTDNSKLTSIFNVIDRIEYYVGVSDLESLKKKFKLDNEQYFFFIELLPNMKEYKTELEKTTYKRGKRLRSQISIIKHIVVFGVKDAADYYNLSEKFLRSVFVGSQWKLANWLINNYEKYKNIF